MRQDRVAPPSQEGQDRPGPRPPQHVTQDRLIFIEKALENNLNHLNQDSQTITN